FCFFASRRRHTRFSRDWSSDVCSSDLDTGLPPIVLAAAGLLLGACGLTVAGVTGILPMAWSFDDVAFRFGAVPWYVPVLAIGLRSEERRVGKETSSRGKRWSCNSTMFR